MDIHIIENEKDYHFDEYLTKDSIIKDNDLSTIIEESIHVVGDIHLIGEERFKIKLNITGNLYYPCSRCLDPVKHEADYSLEEELDLEDSVIHVDEFINDCLFINEPYQIYCKEDCKGLCPSCGVNLNHETCNCASEEDEIDPRLEKLKQLL